MGFLSTEAPIRPSLSFCIEQMAKRGFDIGQLLVGSSLDQISYQKPQTVVSARQELAIYRNILNLSRSGAVGLDIGQAVNPNSVGILGAVVANAFDLGHAGYLLRRFHALTSPWFTPELIGELSQGQLIVRYKQTHDLGGAYRLIIDRDIRGTQILLTEIFGAGAAKFICGIAFGYPEPAGSKRYRSEFGCQVSFGHEYTYVTFDSDLAGLKNERRNGLSYNSFLQLCREALVSYASSSWHRNVLNILSSDDVYPKAEQMASKLNCSERSLRRHLNEEGFQYSELIDRVRFDRAVYLLTHSRDSIKKIGFQLRYSEPANFVHAFIRWSGVSPTQFRNSALKMT